MFETLSTVALTVSASIVVAFLSQAFARKLRRAPGCRRRSAAWFALVLRLARPPRSIPSAGLAFPRLA